MEQQHPTIIEDERGRYDDHEVAAMAQAGIRIVRPRNIADPNHVPAADYAEFRAVDERRAVIAASIKNMPDIF